MSTRKVFKEVKDIAFILVCSLIVALTFRSTVMARVNVLGHSMDHTLSENDSLFMEKISLFTKNINKGEIVVLDSKNQNEDKYIKRVIGTEGDTLEINNGKVYLNDKELKEDYLNKSMITNGADFLKENEKYTVPKDCIFVMGDNRANSCDSRYFGPVKISDLKGHVIVRVYPFNKIKVF